MNRIDVPSTLREMWDTRPARPREGRQVAGVALAIANRYDIDPVLVRIGFVVTAFSGVGAALYAAGWILLPDAPALPGQPQKPAGPRGIMVLAFAAGLIATVAALFNASRFGDLVLPLLAAAVLLFLLHHARGSQTARTAPVAGPEAPPVPRPTPPAAQPPTGATARVSMVKGSATAAPAGDAAPEVPAAEPPLSPPAWDPLGAAPFAWDLPEPGPLVPPVVAAPPPRRKLPVGAVTFSLALLAGGITAVVLLMNHALVLANGRILLGVVLATLGLGLVFGAFVRSGRGLIPVAVLVGALTWLVLAAPRHVLDGSPAGDLHIVPTTASELAPSYERSVGEVTLDLRHLDLSTTGPGAPDRVETTVNIGAGSVTVLLPPNADVSLTASTGVGSIDFGNRSASGPGADLTVDQDLGADGTRTGKLLALTIDEGLGDVEVRRG